MIMLKLIEAKRFRMKPNQYRGTVEEFKEWFLKGKKKLKETGLLRDSQQVLNVALKIETKIPLITELNTNTIESDRMSNPHVTDNRKFR